MPKHPTPKKKTAKRTSRQRYGSFKTKVLKRLSNAVSLVTCPTCGEKAQAHTVCKACGQYKGRQVLDTKKKVEKITKIKA